MKAIITVIPRAFLVLSFSLVPLLAQTPGTQQQQPEFIRQGQQLMRGGKLDDALALYRKTLQTSPNSVPANIAAGSVLDLMGQGEEARMYFAKAIDLAETPDRKAAAQRAMAISYAFEGNCKKTVEYEQQVFGYYRGIKNFFQQGEVADEAARVCIDSGDLEPPTTGISRPRHWIEGTRHPTGPERPLGVPLGARAGPHRCSTRKSSRSAEAVAAAKAILERAPIPSRRNSFPICKDMSRSTAETTRRRSRNC